MDIDLDVVETWIAQMCEQGSGATTVIRAYGALAGILDSAVKAKRLRSNPVRGVENLPKRTGKHRVYLTDQGVRRLAAESGEHSEPVLTLAFCGLRWGEAVALQVRDIELLRPESVSMRTLCSSAGSTASAARGEGCPVGAGPGVRS